MLVGGCFCLLFCRNTWFRVLFWIGMFLHAWYHLSSMTFMFYMPIFVIGLGSSFFVQFSFFFNVSRVFRTIGLSRFAFWLLAMNLLILQFHGILVVWPSLMCRCPPLFSLILLVCSCIWILGFQFCSNWFGSSNPCMLLRF